MAKKLFNILCEKKVFLNPSLSMGLVSPVAQASTLVVATYVNYQLAPRHLITSPSWSVFCLLTGTDTLALKRAVSVRRVVMASTILPGTSFGGTYNKHAFSRVMAPNIGTNRQPN